MNPRKGSGHAAAPRQRAAGHAGADKAYDVARFVDALRKCRDIPHSAVDARRKAAHHAGSGRAVSHGLRKRIEDAFGRIESTGRLAETRLRWLDRVGWFPNSAYLVPMSPRFPEP